MKKQIETEEQKTKLRNVRQNLGLFSIDELMVMFDCGRSNIDFAINANKLQYISPNGRDRYIKLSDFEEYATKNKIIEKEIPDAK